MERIRYFLGVTILIIVPLGLLYWLIIHQWVRWWRMWMPIRTYSTCSRCWPLSEWCFSKCANNSWAPISERTWSLIGIALVLSGYCPMTSLKERELLDGFGDVYRGYQRMFDDSLP